MTRYTVSPPMLIERATLEDLLGQNEKYVEHLSSLQQIRMSEELVKWCEENKKVELDDSEFEVRDEYVRRGGYEKLAFPVEVVDEAEELRQDIAWAIMNHKPIAEHLKSKYKIEKLKF